MSMMRYATVGAILVGGLAMLVARDAEPVVGSEPKLEPSAPASTTPSPAAKPRPAHSTYANSPKVDTSDGARTLYGPKQDAQGRRPARIPELEDALDVEGSNEAWRRDVEAKAEAAIPKEAQLRELDVRCTQTFCRIKMVKPIDTRADWPEIDRSLYQVAAGEAVFLTEREGGVSTGFLYFASVDSHLPLGNLEDDEGT